MKVNKLVNVSPNLNPPKKELQLMEPFHPVLKRKIARKKFLTMKKTCGIMEQRQEKNADKIYLISR